MQTKSVSLFVVVTSLAFISGCEPKVKTKIEYVEVIKEVPVIQTVEVPGSGSTTDSTTNTNSSTSSGVVPSVNMSGTLALSLGSEGGLGLRGYNRALRAEEVVSYDLNCVTLSGGDDVTAIKIPIENEGGVLKFSKNLGEVGGKSIGCFLLKNDEVLTSVIFGSSSNLTPGAGEIVTEISYDEESKRATAKIDSAKSTALFPDAVAKAKKDTGAVDTNIDSLPGTYNVSCVAESGMQCNPASIEASIPSSVYIAAQSTAGQVFATMWKSKTKHDQCVPPNTTATESKPVFGMRFGSNLLELDFRGTAALNASLDAFYGTLKGSADSRLQKLSSAIESNVVSRSSWKNEFCAQNIFTEDNCKLFLAKKETYSWIDYNGKEVTNSYVKWLSDVDFQGPSYTGVVTSKFVPCSAHWTADKDMCPPGVAGDDGQGTTEAFFGVDDAGVSERVRLVCVRPGRNWPEYQQNALAATKAVAVTAAATEQGCDVIAASTGNPFNGKRELFRTEVRNVISELASHGMYSNGQALCRHKSLPANFTFKDCASVNVQALNYMYWDPKKPEWITKEMEQSAASLGQTYQYYDAEDRGVQEFCRNFGWSSIKNSFDIDPSTGGLNKRTDGSSSINSWEAEELCPTAYAAAGSNKGSTNTVDCVNEFNALTTPDQVSAVLRQRIGKWQPMVYAACSQNNDSDRAFFEDSNTNSCLPVAGMTMMCGSSGTCVASLRCFGTEGGKCFENDKFIGRIPGRISAGLLEKGTEGAFSITSSVKDSYMSWNETARKMELVTMLNETVIQGSLTLGEDDFSAFLKRKIKKKIEALNDSNQVAATVGNGGTVAAGANMNGAQNRQDQIPEEDLMIKLKFVKQ